MDDSRAQFRERVAQRAGQVTRMLGAGYAVLPVDLRLILRRKRDRSVGASDSADPVPSAVRAMSVALAETALSLQVVASCIPDPAKAACEVLSMHASSAHAGVDDGD